MGNCNCGLSHKKSHKQSQVVDIDEKLIIQTIDLKTLNQMVISHCTQNPNEKKFDELKIWNMIMCTNPSYSNIEVYIDNNHLATVLNEYHKSRTSLNKHIEVYGLRPDCKLVLTTKQKNIYDYFMKKFVTDSKNNEC